MKHKRIIYLIIVFITLFFYYCYHNFFSLNSVAGTYLNTNFEYGPYVAEVPYGQDSIVLNTDKTMNSTYWGNGHYEIEYSLKGTKIKLKYDYEYGNAGFDSQIERRFFSEPRLILVPDMNHYMRKIKN